MVRDQALAVSGLLSRKMYGPPVRPPQPTLGLERRVRQRHRLEDQRGRGPLPPRRSTPTWRRIESVSVDGHLRRAQPRGLHACAAIATNTPLQALVTLNDPVYIEAAQALARRMVAAGGSRRPTRRGYGFRAVPGAAADATRSCDRLVQLYRSGSRDVREATRSRPRQLATEPLGPLPQGCRRRRAGRVDRGRQRAAEPR